MSKRVFRYFLDFLDGQKRWLNQMAARGYRLKECGKLMYVFEECQPGEYEYTVEFVGHESNAKARDYQRFLEEMGFRTFSKNINLNFSIGKVRWRPYGKGMGQIATSPGAFNKELLILEKKNDGKPFDLHTDCRDRLETYKNVMNAYIYAVTMMLGLFILTFISGSSTLSLPLLWVLRAFIAALGILYFFPAIKYSLQVRQLKTDSRAFD